MASHWLGEFCDYGLKIELRDVVSSAAKIMHHDIEIVPRGLRVTFLDRDPKSFERTEQQFDIFIHKGKEEVGEILAFFRSQYADDSEVQEHDVSFFCHQQVARVRIPVKEPVLEDHLHVCPESANTDLVRVKTHGSYRIRIINPNPLNKLHDQDLRR